LYLYYTKNKVTFVSIKFKLFIILQEKCEYEDTYPYKVSGELVNIEHNFEEVLVSSTPMAHQGEKRLWTPWHFYVCDKIIF